MNRLQKKCFIASAGMHLLMAGILFVGPAFLSSPDSKSEDVPIINFIPLITTDQNVSGGGSPTGSPPPPAPRERTPAPPAEPVRASEPPRVPETRAEPVPEPKPARRPQIQVSRNRIRAGSTTAPANDTRTETARELRNQVSAALRDVRNSLSSSTSIELRGPGGGGVPYANWLAAVKKAYTDAWLPPEGIQDDSATATVSITIARDGTVVDWRFVKRSGNAVVDSSIESAVKRVRPAPKLPAEAKEDQRTVIIDFNLKVKQLLG